MQVDAAPHKILVCGDVGGKLKALVSRVNKVIKAAGQFDIMFCVGDFFGDSNKELEEFIEGSFKGSKGIYTTVSGLRVVYVSDPEDASSGVENLPSAMLSNALAAEDIGFIGVDLLLSTQWPTNVDTHVTSPTPNEIKTCLASSSTSMSKLAYFLRPRYHFSSGMGCYFEREPYRNHRVLQEKASHVTRFIALANVKNPLNRKEVQTDQYFYDMNKPRNQSSSSSRKRRMKSRGDDADSEALSMHRKRRAETLEEKLAKPREQAACWFCLGNPQVKKHLIISVNTQAYVALPRGPLVKDHVLVLTVGHHRSWTSCPDYVRAEIEDYKERLKNMFTAEGKAMVAFERNLRTQHYQLQVVPIPFAVAGEVKRAFLELSARCENSPCVMKPIPRNTELSEICSPGVPYFYVELPTGERLFGTINKDRVSTSDIQFGRTVLSDARILNCPDKADWRNCTDEVEDETKLAAEMREIFAPHDIDCS